jgi:hypothetical protein
MTKKLDHGMLLDGKQVMDNLNWAPLDDLVPKRLHKELEKVIEGIESDLAECDVSDRYEEKE